MQTASRSGLCSPAHLLDLECNLGYSPMWIKVVKVGDDHWREGSPTQRNKTASTTCCWRNGDSQHGVETCQVIKEFHRMFGMPPLQLAVTHTATFCTAGLCWWIWILLGYLPFPRLPIFLLWALAPCKLSLPFSFVQHGPFSLSLRQHFLIRNSKEKRCLLPRLC